jgi:hypothetical protein
MRGELHQYESPAMQLEVLWLEKESRFSKTHF